MKKLLLAIFFSLIPVAATFSAGRWDTSDENIKLKWQNGSRSIEVKVAGTVAFADDDRDVKSLSPYGLFSLKESRWWLNSRCYRVTADSSGRLTRSYFEDGEEKALDHEGRAWLTNALPEIIRETGVGVGPRVERILRERGPSGVLAEIRLIRSDESKRAYLEELIRNGNLGPDQLRSAMREARHIGSDDDKSRLLLAIDSMLLKDDLRDALFGVVDTISSDDEHRRVLSELVRQDGQSLETLTLAVRSAGRISSDDEKAGILVEVAERYKGHEAIRWPYFKAANSISSDEERRHVLDAVLTYGGSDRDTLVDSLRSAAGISSDDEKAGVLIEACHYYTEDDAIRQAFFRAANGISSDEERQRALSELIHRPALDAATLTEVARSAKQISSDEEKTKVLSEMTALNVQDAAVGPEFFEAVNSISSDEEHEKVLSRLVGKSGMANETLMEVVNSAGRISSDEEKAKVLLEMRGLDLKSDRLRAAFFKATDSISSDEEHGRVLAGLMERRDLSTEGVVDVINSAEHISSDEVKAGVLKKVTDSYSADPAVRARLKAALESLQSNDEYRELMSALVKQESAH